MLKKIMMLSVALTIVPGLAADELENPIKNPIVKDSVVKAGICNSVVSFVKGHKTAFVVAAVVAASGWYAYNNGYLKRKEISE